MPGIKVWLRVPLVEPLRAKDTLDVSTPQS